MDLFFEFAAPHSENTSGTLGELKVMRNENKSCSFFLVHSE